MKLYADTSVLIAWFNPADEFAPAVTRWCRSRSAEFCWNPFLRAEVRHNLRKVTGRYGALAWQAYRACEAAGLLKLDRARPGDLLDAADQLSTQCAAKTTAGTWDCVHVAAAQHAGVSVFATCDSAQAELARLARIPQVRLLKSNARGPRDKENQGAPF